MKFYSRSNARKLSPSPLSLPKKMKLCSKIKLPAEPVKHIIHNGNQFVFKVKRINGNRCYYSFCLSKSSDYSEKLVMKVKGKVALKEEGEQYSYFEIKNGIKTPYLKDINDLTFEMAERVEEFSLAIFSTKPKDIWKKVLSEMTEKSDSHLGMKRYQVINKVKHVRMRETGSDIFFAIEGDNLARVKDSKNFFLQLNVSIPFNEEGKIHCIIRHGNPDLFPLLIGKVKNFLDCNFRSVLHPFYQYFVLIECDMQIEVHVPVIYILMNGKVEIFYWHVFY